MNNENNLLLNLLIGLSVFLLLFANFSFWLSSTIYNSDAFNKNIKTVFKSQEVRDAIAKEVVDRTTSENPGLEAIVTSPATSAISGLLASPQLDPLIDRLATRTQNYITTGQNEVSLDLAPINTILTAINRVTSGQNEAPQIQNTNIVIFPANAFPVLGDWLKPITTFGPILGLIGLIILIVLFLRAADKYGWLRKLGVFLLAGTVINFLLVYFIETLIPQYVTEPNATVIASEIYNAFSPSYLNRLLLFILLSIALILFSYYWPRYYKNKEKELT